MNMPVTVVTYNVPDIPKFMQKKVSRLDFVVGKISMVDAKWTKLANDIRVTILRSWMLEAENLRDELLELGIVEKSKNHATWRVLAAHVQQELEAKKKLLEEVDHGE